MTEAYPSVSQQINDKLLKLLKLIKPSTVFTSVISHIISYNL